MPPLPARSGLLKIGELAKQSGLPISTIRHYVNEGLLGTPRKTARNMAYYDERSLERISLITRLKDELYLPLKVIKKLVEAYEGLSLDEVNLLLEIRTRLAERHRELLPPALSVPQDIVDQLELSREEIRTLEAEHVVRPQVRDGQKYYDELDYRILKALSDVRASGFGPDLVTIDDLSIYILTLSKLAGVEARLFAKRIHQGHSIDEIVDLVRNGIPAVNEVISALHQRFLLDALGELGPAIAHRNGAERGSP
jgi:DNA-binding transcriptional MerR regulator